ncbi:MAG TPA: (d)CMP kinase [Pirellulaceae bacterium]|nr:(d)CMP kinase [Pirellulaceae bacterium]
MIVTLDGPAGAGKSTIARKLADRLGFAFLDTGAMYRAVTLVAVRNQGPWDDPQSLAELARHCQIEMDGSRVHLNGEDVSELIRRNEVTSHIHYLADNSAVRERMVELQRTIAMGKDIVSEGRDQGTVAFPNAECKIFLTASPEERARRRVQELQARGEQISVEKVLAQQNERDHRDSTRNVGRLERAPDAIDVNTDGMSADEVVERLVEIVRERTQRTNG